MRLQILKSLSLLLAGLIAGTFFYGTFCVLPAFYEVSTEVHLTFRTNLMQHNKYTVMSLVILSIIVNSFYYWEIKKLKTISILCLTALILTVVSLVITRLGSVPINLIMKTWTPASPPSDWLDILAQWDLYNSIRTFTSIGSFICLLLIDFFDDFRNLSKS
jgi:uncharacterized membrane protein